MAYVRQESRWNKWASFDLDYVITEDFKQTH
jgi:hypothetical protein